MFMLYYALGEYVSHRAIQDRRAYYDTPVTNCGLGSHLQYRTTIDFSPANFCPCEGRHVE